MKRFVAILIVLMLLACSISAWAESWVCPNCGTESTGNFCSNCGAKKDDGTWDCPNCGTKNEGNFCGNCGTPKGEAAAEETKEHLAVDVQIGEKVEIPDWGTLTVTAYEEKDYLGHYQKNGGYDMWDIKDNYYYSGNEANYAVLYVDILNDGSTSKNYLMNISIKAIFNGKIEYDGWAYQRNYNYGTVGLNVSAGEDKNKENIRWAIAKENNFAIEPMYEGHYIFGCTLPNNVIHSDKPLCITITIDGNEFTYQIQ